MKSFFTTIIILFSSFSHSSLIDLLEYDYLNQGDNLITLDRSTGLQWLDITHTQGMSILEIEASGVMNDGWKWATKQQTTGLFNHALPTHNIYNAGLNLPPAENKAFIDLIGATYGGNLDDTALAFGVSRGFYNELAGGYDTARVYWLEKGDGPTLCLDYGDCVAYGARDGNVWSETDSYFSYGGWLVREVPEPTSILLLTSGIFFIRLFRK